MFKTLARSRCLVLTGAPTRLLSCVFSLQEGKDTTAKNHMNSTHVCTDVYKLYIPNYHTLYSGDLINTSRVTHALFSRIQRSTGESFNGNQNQCRSNLGHNMSAKSGRLVRQYTTDFEKPTIYAVSSGSGRAGIAVIRVSGPSAGLVKRMLRKGRNLPAPRMAQTANIHHPETREFLDQAMVLWLPAPHTLTGEDVVELHVHGGPAGVRAVLEALGVLPHFRLAMPGEFMRRAFTAGKLDLTQVEGVADLLAADTPSQHKEAVSRSGGALRGMLEEWRTRLLRSQARVEAVIDFGEDEEIGDEILSEVNADVLSLSKSIAVHLEKGLQGEIVREGVRVALIGPPNVGKSSLLNLLAGREAAIVSPHAGTTRDLLPVSLDLQGFKVVLTDCAGVRDTEDPVEEEGVRRSLETARTCHLCVLVLDAATILPGADPTVDSPTSSPSKHITVVERSILSDSDSALHTAESPPSTSLSLSKNLPSTASTSTTGLAQTSQDSEADFLYSLFMSAALTEAGKSSSSSSITWPPTLLVVNKSDKMESSVQDFEQGRPPFVALTSQGPRWVTATHIRTDEVPSTSRQVAEKWEISQGVGWAHVNANTPLPMHPMSCKTGDGVDEFVHLLQEEVSRLCTGGVEANEGPMVTRERHRQHLRACAQALTRFQEASTYYELGAEELRTAATELGHITGVIQVEDILEHIFSEFCIGK